MTTISTLRRGDRSLEVTWSDAATTKYPWIWLRDHAHDEDTLHPITQQRQLFTAALPAELRAASAAVTGESVVVNWDDGTSPSVLPVSFLAAHRGASPARAGVETSVLLWDRQTIEANLPTVAFDEIMENEDGLRRWLAALGELGFCIAAGTPPTAAATEALLRRIGYVRETIFGGMWEFTADLTKADTAYTNLELRPHTDGTYSHDAPGVQLLHCMHFEGTGGATTMVDAFAIADRMQREAPAHFATLSNVSVPGQYIGDGAHLIAARPVFRHDHIARLVQVSFNNYDRAPFLLPENEMIAFYDALRTFESLANDPKMQWRHVLAPGEALLFDNWRVLHGRFAYTGTRHMCGGYVNREDVESRLRQLL
ncbi:MAG: trimethyllysine dioxygenase [Ilumatobacteraceae bacterium]